MKDDAERELVDATMEDVLPGLNVTDGQRRLVDGGGGDRAGSGSRSQLDKVEPGDAEEVALLVGRCRRRLEQLVDLDQRGFKGG